MKRKIAITGTIGSGKSAVAEALRVMNYAVYDSDREAKRLINEDPALRQKLTETFGTEIYERGKLNKPLFASLIFGNETLRLQANAIIHPAVYRHFDRWAELQNSNPVFIETALYDGWGGLEAWVVCAPLALRIKRVMQRDNCSEQAVLERLNRQLPQEEMIRKADYIIWNDEQHSVLQQLSTLNSPPIAIGVSTN